MWMDGPIPPELGRFPGYLMARLGQTSSRRFAEALQPLGLHPRDFGVMSIVAANPGISQQALSEHTGIDASSMTALIDELESLRVAERRPHPGDRRARAIHLTPSGEEALQRARKVAGGLQGELLAALTADEQRTLLELLGKLAADSAGRDGAARASGARRAG
jgi:DNA-binding MarR family transcriptional regulator